jgi:Transcription factor Iwr1
LGIESSNALPSRQDTIKRAKVEQPQSSIFTLALTVDSTEYPSLETINVQDLYKSTLESRPVSSDSDNGVKKRSFSNIIDPPKFRMSRKRPRQTAPDEQISTDYVLFDAIREPIRVTDGIPEIRSSGIPNEIQSGDPSKDAILNDMLKSYLTIDQDNRTFLNLKDEYVYDIYYRSGVSPNTVPTDANFGVLVYESDPELDEDEEVGDEEDVDSNSEGYYQNSYPDEDEWAGEGWGSEEDEDTYGKRHSRRIGFDSDEEIGEDSEDDRYSYSETD